VTDGADASLAPIARSGRGNLWCNRRANPRRNRTSDRSSPLPALRGDDDHDPPPREHRDQARSLALRVARYDEPRSLDRGEQALCRSAQAAPIYKKTKPLEPEESAIRPEAGSFYSLTGAGTINCSRNLSQASTRKPNLVSSTWSLSALLCFTDLSQTSLPS
jgi:hypothetical protein